MKKKEVFIWVIPGRIGDTLEPIRSPSGNQRCIASPIRRPNAAPVLKMGIKLPEGTGNVDAKMVSNN